MAKVLGAKDGTLLCVFSKAGSVSNLNLKERKLWVWMKILGKRRSRGALTLPKSLAGPQNWSPGYNLPPLEEWRPVLLSRPRPPLSWIPPGVPLSSSLRIQGVRVSACLGSQRCGHPQGFGIGQEETAQNCSLGCRWGDAYLWVQENSKRWLLMAEEVPLCSPLCHP